jgi:glutathione synthase/RimK-type ligase-like ATP-grasp enzyme
MILILGDHDDVVVHGVERELRARGASSVRLASTSFPGDACLDARWTPHGPARRMFRLGGETIDLDAIGAVYHRHMRAGRPVAVSDRRARAFAELEGEAVLLQLCSQLGAPFVPAPWATIRAGQAKLMQLSLAARLGFEIPPSIVTTDPAALLDFVREHGGRCITKHVSHQSTRDSRLDDDMMRFTEPVTRRDLAALRSVRLAPVYAQAYVPKRVELRVTVVGERVFAAEIDSQAAARTRHDYRRMDQTGAAYRVHALPDVVATRCVAVARALDLRYGALDLVLTPDGRYVFLEINPAGEFHWIERLTGLPITAAIADLLTTLDHHAP